MIIAPLRGEISNLCVSSIKIDGIVKSIKTVILNPSSTTFILKIIKKVYQTSQPIVFIDLIISELECRD